MATFQVDQDTPKAPGRVFGRLRSDVPDLYVRGWSMYTTEHAHIQPQEISKMMTPAVPRMRVIGPLGQVLAVCCAFISGRARINLRPPEGFFGRLRGDVPDPYVSG